MGFADTTRCAGSRWPAVTRIVEEGSGERLTNTPRGIKCSELQHEYSYTNQSTVGIRQVRKRQVTLPSCLVGLGMRLLFSQGS